ncbi:WW domain-containing oxidoreductase [Acrodontium crateriforme]|uniref:WW domain-containing oxidoreductase n=1 Tax=Acrodontium crateriforme TaxID=150365 RepID=A0AAQ3MCT9_9PEZI|nr:WW domain-containing oxidoreductase [Acrodontium crateriforme]
MHHITTNMKGKQPKNLGDENLKSLAFAPSPPWYWRIRMALKGTNRQRLTCDDVPMRGLTGKWIIISGSNNGIGREAALSFARCGANIVLACRDPPSHEMQPADVAMECKMASEAAGHDKAIIEWWEVDMATLHSVNAFADRWLRTERPLDILCNNAGIGGNPGDAQGILVKTEDNFEIVHQVNFLSHVLLTLRLLSSLARAERPRVVCTTSCMMFFGTLNMDKFNSDGCKGEEFYCNNKLFLQIWLTELQHRLSESERYSHILINGVHPGYTNTGIWHVARPPGWISWIRQLPESILVTTLANLFAISAEQGSYAIVNAAFGPKTCPNGEIEQEGKGNEVGGRYFNRIWEAQAMPYCDDQQSRSLVWNQALRELDLEDGNLFELDRDQPACPRQTIGLG